jgi:hypothetical protein
MLGDVSASYRQVVSRPEIACVGDAVGCVGAGFERRQIAREVIFERRVHAFSKESRSASCSW